METNKISTGTVDATIQAKLMASLEPVSITLLNESYKHAGHTEAPAAGNSHFALTIVSSKFINASLKQRHVLVYQALAGMIGHEIHALSIVALTPDEASKRGI